MKEGTISDGAVVAEDLAGVETSAGGVGAGMGTGAGGGGTGVGDGGEVGCHAMDGVVEEGGRFRKYWRCWAAARTFGTTDAGSNE